MASKVTYSIAVDLRGVAPDSKALAQQIVTAGLHAPDYINVDIDQLSIVFASALSGGEKTTLDGVIGSHSLPVVRTQKCAAIDARTQALIDAGFVFDGRTYALDGVALQQLIAFDSMRADLTYAVELNTKDNTFKLKIGSSDDLHAFCLAGFVVVRANLDSGTALKDLVRAAAAVADVKAIVDPR